MKLRLLCLLGACLPLAALADNTVSLTCPQTQTVSVYNTSFQATTQIPVTQAKIDFVANATLNPQNLAAFMQSLSTLKDAQGNALVLKNLSQNKTDSGLINVVATLQDTVSINNTGTAYQFAAQHTNAGVVYTVASITPYLSVDAQSDAAHALELQLYKKAVAYQQQLNATGGPNYHIVNFAVTPASMPEPRPITPMMIRTVVSNANFNSNNSSGAGLSVDQTLNLVANVTYNGS